MEALKLYAEHGVHEELKVLRKALRAKNNPKLDDLTGEQRSVVLRLRWVLREVSQRIERADPLLASIASLNTFESLVSKMRRIFTAFEDAADDQMQSLVNQTDNIAHHLYILPTDPDNKEEIEDFAEFLEDLGVAVTSTKAELANVDKKAEEAESALVSTQNDFENLKGVIDTQKSRLDEFITNTNSQYNDAETKRSQAASELLDQHRKDTAESIADSKSVVDTAMTETTAKLVSEIDAIKQEFQQQMADEASTAGDIIKTLQDKLAQAEKVVGLVVDTVTTGNYKVIAERELKSAKNMRRWALLLFMGGAIAIVGLVVYFYAASAGEIELGTLILRSLLGAILFVPAGYCAREASKHQLSERSHRRIALELTSIHPFIDPLPEEVKKELLTKRVDSYFNNRIPPEYSIVTDKKTGSILEKAIDKAVDKVSDQRD